MRLRTGMVLGSAQYKRQHDFGADSPIGGIGGGASAVHAGLKHAASTSSPPVSPPSTLQYRKKFRRMSREGSSSGE